MIPPFVAKLIETSVSFQASLLQTLNQTPCYFDREVLIIVKILCFLYCLSWEHNRHTLSFGLGVHAFVFNPEMNLLPSVTLKGLFSHGPLRSFSFSLGSVSVNNEDLMAFFHNMQWMC